MEKVIELEKVGREFVVKDGFMKKKTVIAVKNVSVDIKKGEIFGILGENGAGKTTMIKMMTTLLAPSSGACKILGYDTVKEAKKIRKKINFIFGGETGIYRRLTGRENLEYFAGLYMVDLKEIKRMSEYLLERFGLIDVADRRAETYSKGMIQRLQISRGLLNDPEVVFMDEPTLGLDPVCMELLHGEILNLKQQGKTIVLTTHYMQEADDLCDRIAVIKEGQILLIDNPDNIKIKYGNTLENAFINLIKNDDYIDRHSN